ncbi:MFS transporter [Lentzea rhizosphaerae]|uniref:MFS transporter n=1 Tax=Lentzea rhizosphaerae TaxID=2041025 RepID=A0ABV8C8R3_9PSEU
MITQSFLYNAIFFAYTLVLGKFYGVPSEMTPLYLIAFAVGNLVGPFTIGHLFDTIGRRRMLFSTYVISGALLGVTAVLFYAGALNAITQTIAWCVIFFFASAGASAAYLTVSEIFPLEVRAKAIGVFFAIALCFGALGPVIYGALIGTGSHPVRLFVGWLHGSLRWMRRTNRWRRSRCRCRLRLGGGGLGRRERLRRSRRRGWGCGSACEVRRGFQRRGHQCGRLALCWWLRMSYDEPGHFIAASRRLRLGLDFGALARRSSALKSRAIRARPIQPA